MSTHSGRHQRSRLPHEGRASGAAPDDGEIHGKYAHNTLREQHFQINSSDQVAVSSNTCRGAFRR